MKHSPITDPCLCTLTEDLRTSPPHEYPQSRAQDRALTGGVPGKGGLGGVTGLSCASSIDSCHPELVLHTLLEAGHLQLLVCREESSALAQGSCSPSGKVTQQCCALLQAELWTEKFSEAINLSLIPLPLPSQVHVNFWDMLLYSFQNQAALESQNPRII